MNSLRIRNDEGTYMDGRDGETRVQSGGVFMPNRPRSVPAEDRQKI